MNVFRVVSFIVGKSIYSHIIGRHLIYLLLRCYCIINYISVLRLKFPLSNIYLDERNSLEIYKKMITLYCTRPRPLSVALQRSKIQLLWFSITCAFYMYFYILKRARNFPSACLQEPSFTRHHIFIITNHNSLFSYLAYFIDLYCVP